MTYGQVLTGADRLNRYLPLLSGKRVGVFANQTSLVGKTHLVDTLIALGVEVKVIFGPEHGFRGKADAGEKVGNAIDEKTGIPVVSLYGAKRRPDQADLSEVDVMLFDIQDVGVRFYTFISSLEEYIQSAIEFQKLLKQRNSINRVENQAHFRVGINLGDVIVQGNDLMGEGINIAARLESIGIPGGICISSVVHSEVRKRFDSVGFYSRGLQSLKNIEDPVEVFDISIDKSPIKYEAPKPSPASCFILAILWRSNTWASCPILRP